jgi:restriction system protein
MFEVRIQHPGLRAFRLVKGETKRDAELKAEAQMAIWNQRWARHLSAEKARAEKLGRWLHREEGREQAIALSTEAASQIARVESLLKTCLIRGKFVDWEWLKDKTPFAEPEVDHPKPKSPPAEPQPSEFALPLSILDKIIPPLKARKLERGEAAYQTAHSSWKATSSAVEDENRKETERTKRLVKEREDRKKQYMATVHNEGATKGILVTTSTYGPDAYEFAKGKPLTLLSGSELLYLLGQHGHKSKIDLAAAKIEYKESQRQVTESRAKP